jgi:hypothetical protein
MSSPHVLTCGFLLLAFYTSHVTAGRVSLNIVAARAISKHVTEDAKTDEESYWHTHQGQWELLGLVNAEKTQQFELKEDYRILRTKKYKATLDQEEDGETGVKTRKGIHAKVMVMENHFFTMHATQTVHFANEDGTKIGDFWVYMPQVINRHWSWRIAKVGDENVLFTIQKRLYNDNCKYFNWFSCKPVLKIYVGHKGDKSTLIYYGVGDSDLAKGEPDFKFYHSQDAYTDDKKKWVAKIDHKKTKGNGEDKYKVKVKPGEDAALLLLATTCLDQIGDANKAPDDHDDD